jgi:hypothetical protein
MRATVSALAALALAPLTAGPALAGCYPSYVRTIYKYRTKYVAAPVAVPYAVYQPVYVAQTLPAPSVSYTITTPAPAPAPLQAPVVRQPTYAPQPAPSYAPSYAPQSYAAPSDCASGHAKLAETLARLEAAVTRMQGQQYPPPQAPPQQAPPQGQQQQDQGFDVGGLLQRRCASCHDAGVAAQKGGKFVMFKDGQFTQFDLAKVQRAVLDDSMPKGGPALTAEEKYWLSAWVQQESQPAPERQPAPPARR